VRRLVVVHKEKRFSRVAAAEPVDRDIGNDIG
jgi:hypothetical protein